MIDRQTDAPQQQQQGQQHQHQQQGQFGNQRPAGDTAAQQVSGLAADPQAPRPITDWASI